MELFSFLPDTLFFLFFVAVAAGFLDTLVGGGGLISIPALIASGVPPLLALDTNKLQGSMGTATASWVIFKNRKIEWNYVKPFMLSAFIGAIAGTVIVQFVQTRFLSLLIPIVLFIIAIYFLISPKPKPKSAYTSDSKYRNIIVPSIGFYDGLLGPGTGSFFTLAGVSFRGYKVVHSTAIAKTLNFATNIASLAIYILAGKVIWSVGFLMMCGQFLGALLGAHALFKINPIYLRFMIVFICCVMLIKYCIETGY